MSTNRPWRIESFVDSLTLELDKVRETLAVKAINKPLTYSVKDVSFDLQIFPEFDGNNVRFTTAKPGQEGSSKLSLQLGSITDRQVRETSKIPTKDDISIDTIDEISTEEKDDLKKMGINTYEDFKKTQEKVGLENVGSTRKKNYQKLANLLERARRGKKQPRVSRVSLSQNKDEIIIEGDNLSINDQFAPVARINDREVPVTHADEQQVSIQLGDLSLGGQNELLIAFDPYSSYRLNLKN